MDKETREGNFHSMLVNSVHDASGKSMINIGFVFYFWNTRRVCNGDYIWVISGFWEALPTLQILKCFQK